MWLVSAWEGVEAREAEDGIVVASEGDEEDCRPRWQLSGPPQRQEPGMQDWRILVLIGMRGWVKGGVVGSVGGVDGGEGGVDGSGIGSDSGPPGGPGGDNGGCPGGGAGGGIGNR